MAYPHRLLEAVRANCISQSSLQRPGINHYWSASKPLLVGAWTNSASFVNQYCFAR